MIFRTSAKAPRFCAALLASLMVAACAGRPHDILVPSAQTAPGTSRVDLFVATTRSPDKAEPGNMFGGERAAEPSYAAISVSIPPDQLRKIGEVQWPHSSGDPSREMVTVRADILDHDKALKELHAAMRTSARRQVLVFVHGYNNGFDEAVFRFAQIVHDSGTSATPVLFTWPSAANVLAYNYDRESATYSRDALETLLQGLCQDPTVADVTILAHSMGNWVAIEALRQMAIRHGRVPGKISTVMLAAPDVDIDVFRNDERTIGPRSPKFILLVSQDDRALAWSRRLAGKTRLGAINPNDEPYKSELQAAGVSVIDLTDVKANDMMAHSKFANSPEVVRLIGQRLAAGQTIEDEDVAIGGRIELATEGLAGAVGAAAGVAVSTPIATVDPDTRAELGDEIKEVRDNAALATGDPSN